jgi:hypothetical protein
VFEFVSIRVIRVKVLFRPVYWRRISQKLFCA